MHFSFASGDFTRTKTDLLVIPLFDNEVTDKRKQPKLLQSADKKLKGLLQKTAVQEGFKGKSEQLFCLNTTGRVAPARVLLLGLGARTKFNAEVLRMAAGRAVKAANKMRVKNVIFALPTVREIDQAVRATVEGFALGGYRYDRWRTTNKEEKNAPRTDRVTIGLPDGMKKDKSIDAAVALGLEVAEATNWARDLVNEPAGTMTPTVLADHAKQMAKATGLNLQVSDRKKIEELKMGLFIGVTQGSKEDRG
jgi:leucyl aminopeptidase